MKTPSNKQVIFVSGIDTGVGKTIATGVYAQKMQSQGILVSTQKMVQTGCLGQIADDILIHRQIQGIVPTQEDLDGTTCPYVFEYPCSPHLAAKMAKRPILPEIIDEATQKLLQKYDCVLLEGAGGLLVPYNENETLLDFIAQRAYPVILVTSGKLGSINHTLLSLEACRQRNVTVLSLIYNEFPKNDKTIEDETKRYLSQYLAREFKQTKFEILKQEIALK